MVHQGGQILPSESATVTSTPSFTGPQVEQQQREEKQRINQLAKILNKKLIDECILIAKKIARSSFNAIKTSKMLINKGMDADINIALQLEVYGWALCFAHEDRQKMMSSFLNNKSKKK